MAIRKFRWSRVYESSEEELLNFLVSRNINAERWGVDEFHDFGGHVYSQDTTIFCAEGSVTYEIGREKFSLQPGDALRIFANEVFAARAGMSGCVCYEAKVSL